MATNQTHIWLAVLSIMTLIAPVAGIAGTPGARLDHRPAAGTPNAADATVGVVEAALVSPRINLKVPKNVRSKIESGFQLAVHRAQQPECRALFAGFGKDGVEMLSTTLYYKAELKMEKRVCDRAYGFTLVGGAPTWLCRQFSRLSDKRAAAVLLHEALHHAGMDEWPHDPDGPTPAAIDEMVEDACGF